MSAKYTNHCLRVLFSLPNSSFLGPLITMDDIDALTPLAWPGVNDITFKTEDSPHLAAWKVSTYLCHKYHNDTNSCFMPSDFSVNVHIRDITEITNLVPSCPSVSFYQRYHVQSSRTFSVPIINDLPFPEMTTRYDYEQSHSGDTTLGSTDGYFAEDLCSSPQFTPSSSATALPVSVLENKSQDRGTQFEKSIDELIQGINLAIENVYT